MKKCPVSWKTLWYFIPYTPTKAAAAFFLELDKVINPLAIFLGT
jgi:hypothetical protein